jgi:hypothetical protein
VAAVVREEEEEEEEEVLTDNETSVALRVMFDSHHEEDISPFYRLETVFGTRPIRWV